MTTFGSGRAWFMKWRVMFLLCLLWLILESYFSRPLALMPTLQNKKWCTCVRCKDTLAEEWLETDSRGSIRLNRGLQLTPYKEVQLIRTLSAGRQQWGPDTQTLTPGGLETKGRERQGLQAFRTRLIRSIFFLTWNTNP